MKKLLVYCVIVFTGCALETPVSNLNSDPNVSESTGPMEKVFGSYVDSVYNLVSDKIPGSGRNISGFYEKIAQISSMKVGRELSEPLDPETISQLESLNAEMLAKLESPATIELEDGTILTTEGGMTPPINGQVIHIGELLAVAEAQSGTEEGRGFYGTSNAVWRWSNGTVRYRFQPNVPAEVRQWFKEGSEKWKQGTSSKVKFDEIADDWWIAFRWIVGWDYHVSIEMADLGDASGDSTMGAGPWKKLRLDWKSYQESPNWLRNRTIPHEIGHTLGLYHEHQRYDRDDYINLNRSNFKGSDSSWNVNMGKINKETYTYIYFDIFGWKWKVRFDHPNSKTYGAVDFSSIMMYDSSAFSNGNGPTMKRKDGSIWYSGSVISNQDFSTVKEMY